MSALLLAVAADALRDEGRPRLLLQQAQGRLQKWPEGFPGFRARLAGMGAGRDAAGWVECRSGGSAVVHIADDVLREAAVHWLAQLVEERTPHFFKDRDGRFRITLDPEPDAAGGVRLWVDRPDERVGFALDGAGRIRVIERHGRDARMVATVEEYARATPGRVLPARVATSVWSAADGRLVHQTVVQDTHVRVQHVWLPAGRQVVPGPALHAAACADVLDLRLEAHEVLETSVGVYLQDHLTWGPLTVLAGGRLDVAWSTIHEGFPELGPAMDAHDVAFSPRVGVLYEFLPGLAAYASYAQSFLPQQGFLQPDGHQVEPETGEQWRSGSRRGCSATA